MSKLLEFSGNSKFLEVAGQVKFVGKVVGEVVGVEVVARRLNFVVVSCVRKYHQEGRFNWSWRGICQGS